MGDVDQMKDSNIILTASPFSNIAKQDVLNSAADVPMTTYKRYNTSNNITSTQYGHTGNPILKPGIPKLSAHEVSDGDVDMNCQVIYPTKHLNSQLSSDARIKTIGFTPSRSILPAHTQSHIKPLLQCSIIESQNVSPLIITPLVNHNSDNIPAKIIPISTPHISHFSVINKAGFYENLPEYTDGRQSLVPGAPPLYTQSDFACFSSKNYYHKKTIVNPAVIHGPISGNSEDQCLKIPNSQHVFKPIISPRPSILRKRDADGILKAQKNLLPLLTKSTHEDNQNIEEIPSSRNGFNDNDALHIDSIMVPQISDVLLPQMPTNLSRNSHIMVDISKRKKPRKQLLPVNQDSPLKTSSDELEYVDEKINDKIDYTEDAINCNDDGDAEDEADDLDDNDNMNVDYLAGGDYDGQDEDYDFRFDFVKSNKTFYGNMKTSNDFSDSSSYTKLKNRRPTLLGNIKTWRGRSRHFQKYTDFKIKETKKQLAEIRQQTKWTSDSRSGWKIRHLLGQFDGMVTTEGDVIGDFSKLIHFLEINVLDPKLKHYLVELVKDNLQRCIVTKKQLEEINQQLLEVFKGKSIIKDVVEKYCPKDLKTKYNNCMTKS